MLILGLENQLLLDSAIQRRSFEEQEMFRRPCECEAPCVRRSYLQERRRRRLSTAFLRFLSIGNIPVVMSFLDASSAGSGHPSCL